MADKASATSTYPSLAGVLPLKAERKKTNSLEQCILLFDSYLKFGAELTFNEFFVVSPRSQLDRIKAKLDRYSDVLPMIYLAEESLIPEATSKYWIGGWRKQQLIKLAIASNMKSDYYITFDADVLFKRYVSNADLFPDGRALLQPLSRHIRPKWWIGSARVLDIVQNPDAPGMNVTPAILHRETVLHLMTYLESLNGKNWINELLKTYQPFPLSLLRKPIPWTEYSLYFLYITKIDQCLDSIHHLTNDLLLISKKSVWSNVDFSQWDAKECFSEADRSVFCVIQSNKKLSFEEIHQKINPLIYDN